MKTTPSLLLFATLSSALLGSGCAKSDDFKQAAQSTKVAAKELAADVKAAAVDTWDSVKDYAYEKREDFAAGLDRMTAKRDAEIQAMNAQLTGLPEATAKQREHAVKEYNEARTYLKSQLEHLRTGTADTWAATKEKAAASWQAVEAAFEKVKSSPTS
jgi:hypothetical protein